MKMVKDNSKENGPAQDLGADIFDGEKLRLTQSFDEIVGVKKIVTTVPVKKRDKQEFIRVRQGEEWRLNTCLLNLKEDREHYLVDPNLWSELSGEIQPTLLLTTITRQNVVSLWPIRLPGSDGRLDNWSRSAYEAAALAEKQWVRVVPNMSLGAYDIYTATGDLPEPVWPDLSFRELLHLAFKDNFIQDLNHPIVHRLRGAL